MEDLKKLEKVIGYKFKNQKLLTEALTHRSFPNENNSEQNHNERLEFLGDAVLELVVTEYLFNKYTTFPEGELTSFRSALVKTDSLALEANKLDIGEFLLMSRGEEATGGRKRPYLLANAFEALIGAIYLDSGYKKAQKFILDTLVYKIQEIVENRLDIDPKSKLQELVQDELKITPRYELISASGPDHHKVFVMALIIGDQKFSEGEGESKQAAEQNAASSALLNWDKLKKKYAKNRD